MQFYSTIGLLTAASACAASTLTITGGAFPKNGTAAGVPGVWSASTSSVGGLPTPDQFHVYTRRGYDLLGINSTGRDLDGEIDTVDGQEWFQIDFAAPVTVSELTIAHLFLRGERSDLVDEVAAFEVTFADGNASIFTFRADGVLSGFPNSGISVSGSPFADLRLATLERDASLGGIFGDAIRSIRFFAVDSALASRSDDSDFAFASMTVTAVPLPTAAGGAAVMFALGIRRRR